MDWFNIIIGFLIILFLIGLVFKDAVIGTKKRKLLKSNLSVKKKVEKIVKKNYEFRKSYFARFLSLLILIILMVALFVYLMVTRNVDSIFGIFIVLAVLAFLMHRCKIGYAKGFKDNVVTKVVKAYNSNLEYSPDSGFTEEEYKKCKFKGKCDRFHSEDLIIDKSTGFRCADILIKSEYTDNEGSTHTSIEYQGSIASIGIKNCKCEIYLGKTVGSMRGKGEDAIIKFENDEFNKLFSAVSNNELNAYKLLTPDVMEEFVNIKNSTFGDIDIRILNDKLYIRFLSGDGFVPNIFSKKQEIENIASSMAVLEEIINAMDNVKNIINKKGI